jgi:CO/xanthine dehydrogenase Mo-binding subunit
VAARETFVGRSVPRLEDEPLVTGQGRFAADVSFPHQLHMRIVRSGHARTRKFCASTPRLRVRRRASIRCGPPLT